MSRSMKRRVAKLERQLGHKGFPVIIVKTGETKEEAEERHFLKNPDDRECEVSMIIDTIQGGEPREGPPPFPGQEQRQAENITELYTGKPLQITR